MDVQFRGAISSSRKSASNGITTNNVVTGVEISDPRQKNK